MPIASRQASSNVKPFIPDTFILDQTRSNGYRVGLPNKLFKIIKIYGRDISTTSRFQ